MNPVRLSASLAVLALAGCTSAQARPSVTPVAVHAPGNPILADGQYYSTDPAPVVVGDTLWILAGRDEAPPDVNDFIMNEWQALATKDPASGDWLHYPAIGKPREIFHWAETGRAYAGQVVPGRDGKFYLYAPVLQAGGGAKDRFAIGVAVADSPAGPWKDAHPAGPIISQLTPVANDIQNIDPTVMIDDDGRVYIYWGTFGQLRGMELAADMITPEGPEVEVRALDGFFEAPWLMKRKGVYYMLYAGNRAGPKADCTPAVYHACIAYGTAKSPLGPWTYRGVILKPVSSTTSHSGAVEFKGQWYLAYHTADAVGGGHFRRSVALDKMNWDDSVSPPAILPITPTKRPGASVPPSRDIAARATASASNMPLPVQYWIKALNDGITKNAPLPPDLWGSWSPNNPATQWIEYRFDQPVTLDGARIRFWGDQPAGSGIGVAPPKAWRMEYWDAGWKPVRDPKGFGAGVDDFEAAAFAPVTTRCVRAVFDASSAGGTYAGLAVQEWEVLAPTVQPPGAGSGTAPACDAKS
jgi:hypothetical protein